ncbi:MAG: hypothetical protein K0R57_5437 [Paenibacillaceae bacterium]|jgi:putative aldouronate transport system permease protein|nr:hypothetical protein [Paenibacillaceae bacterium]
MRNSIASDKTIISLFYLFVAVFAVLCILPVVIAFSISISSEREVAINGFSLLPMKPTLYTYQYILQNKGLVLLNAYKITLFTVVAGTLFSLAVTTCYAYAAASKHFRFANALSFFAWFTMVFNGGMLPWYILVTKYYHLKNSLVALFVPYAINVFYMFIMKNIFKSISYEFVESAKIDGAGNFRIFFTIMLPLSRVGLVTIGLFYALLYWNDFYLSLMLISDQRLYPVQMLLYAMMSNIQFLASGSAATLGLSGAQAVEIPLMTSRMAMTCLTIGPIILLYPFAQRYFVKGMLVGAIKG